MSGLNEVTSWFDERRHWCMSLLRIYLGIGLTIKAITFIMNIDQLKQMLVEHHMLWIGAGLAHIVIMTHLAGGVLLAVGFATRIAALIQIPNLIGAVFFIHWGGGVFGTPEDFNFSALVLFLLVLFVWHGSGPFSVDAAMREQPAEAVS